MTILNNCDKLWKFVSNSDNFDQLWRWWPIVAILKLVAFVTNYYKQLLWLYNCDKGPSINDVHEFLGILDPPPPRPLFMQPISTDHPQNLAMGNSRWPTPTGSSYTNWNLEFIAGYVRQFIMTMWKLFGDNWTTGTGNIDWFGFPTQSLLEIKMRKYVFSAQKVTDFCSKHYAFSRREG